MELIKEAVTLGELIYADSFEVTADGDLIVPDVKPDILKILQVDASSCVFSKEISAGKMVINGRVDFTILYIPDKEEACVQNMRTSIDFSHKIENDKISEACFASVEHDVTKVDFHVINSRKISLKATTTIGCEITSRRTIEIVTGLDGCNECRKNTLSLTSLCDARDEEFVIKEMIEIPTGKASISEVLKVDYRICDKEVKTITEKVIVKGSLGICVLYLDTGGNLEYTDAEIPFTEVFDFPDMDEEMQCSVNFRACDFYYDTSEDSDGDRRLINVELLLCAEMKAEKAYSPNIVADCFCPGNRTELTYNEISINETVCTPTSQNAIRDVAVIEKDLPQVSAVYNVITKAYVTSSHAKSGKLAVEGKIDAYILYISDEPQSPLYSFKKEIPFSYMLDCAAAAENARCSVCADVSHTSYHVNVANEVELRCILSISANVYSEKKLSLIEEAEVGEISEENKKGIVIYFVQPGDSLWSIAKNYSVSTDDIAEFNNIENRDKISVGQRLVIPAAGR